MFFLALRMLLLSARYLLVKCEADSLLFGSGSVIIWLLGITKGMPLYLLEVYCRLDLNFSFLEKNVRLHYLRRAH